ncbi:MAG: tail fiber domain-containing protein [Dysgonomonas sp.]|nr:tail fiber domain-containing protein [Dysgonomonas sp.]
MKRLNILFLVFLLFLTAQQVCGQVTIGSGKTPASSAVLELDTDALGLLLPRVALSSTTVYTLNGEATHVKGMLVYNTATAGDVKPGIYYNDGAKWVRLDQSTGGGGTPNPITVAATAGLEIKTGTADYTLGIRNLGVITDYIANDAVTSVKILDRTIEGVDISRMNATDKQVLTWVGDATTGNWNPTTINTKDDDYIVGNEVADVIPNQGLYREGNGTATSKYMVGIANGGVTTIKIADGAVTAPKLNQMGATDGQVLKWDNTAKTWKPDTDKTGGGGGTPTTVKATNGLGATPITDGQSLYTVSLGGTLGTPTSIIGTSTNTLTLEGAGALIIDDGNQADGKVLTSNASGVATWQENLAWKITGNSNITANTHFLGTTNGVPLEFRVNNQKSGYLSNAENSSTRFGYQALNTALGTRNVAMGYQAMLNGGIDNVAVGYQALNKGGGTNNIAIGSNTLKVNTASNNIAMGTNALAANTDGTPNIAIGSNALAANVSGANNIAIGNDALKANDKTGRHVAIGTNTLSKLEYFVNTSGGPLDYNSSATAIGYNALANIKYCYQGPVAIGFQSLYEWTGESSLTEPQSSSHTAVGFNALRRHKDGTGNTAIGYQAIADFSGGRGNTAVGALSMGGNAYSIVPAGNDNTAIGYRALREHQGSGDGNTVVGSDALLKNGGEGNTAVGHSSMYYSHHMQSNMNIVTHNTAVGRYAMDKPRGGYNVAVGNQAMQFQDLNIGTTVYKSAEYNTVVGTEAFSSNVLVNEEHGSINNVIIGYRAKTSHKKGSNNVVIGTKAGSNNYIGSNNIYIGTEAGPTLVESGDTDVSNRLQVGNWIYGDLSGTNYRIGINGKPGMTSAVAAEVLQVNGKIKSGGHSTFSDRRLKKNINNMSYGLADVMKLRPVTYQFKNDKSNENKVGFIAQEVKEVIPEVASGTEGDMEKGEVLSIAYGELTAILTKAIQEQQAQIEVQQKLIERLEKRIEELEKK